MEFNEFKKYVIEFKSFSTIKKMKIALKTDFINNIGVSHFKKGDINSAIVNFNQSIEIMPTNDDALLNLARCYTMKEDYENSIECLKKILFVNKNNKHKIIAYLLLFKLVDNFDDEGGAVYSSNLKRSLIDIDIDVVDDEIIELVGKINNPYNRDILTYKIGGGMLGIQEQVIYLTTNGTTKLLIEDELKDVLNWS